MVCFAVARTLGVIVVAVLLSGCIHGRDPALYPPEEGEPTVDVYVPYNWIHANLMVRRELLVGSGGATAQAVARTEEKPWVILGWGDKFCYRERGLTPARIKDLFRFLLLPNHPAVLLIDPVAGFDAPDLLRRKLLKVELSQAGFQEMVDRLDGSFETEDGELRVMGRGRSPDAWFFASTETTDLFFTCNHWVADVLHAAGLPANMPLATLPYGLALHLRWRTQAEMIRAETTPADYFETPPAYSGSFAALSASPEAVTGDLEFDVFRIVFEAGQVYETEPDTLVRAETQPAGGAASYAALLDVAPRSLVALRRVTAARFGGARGLCSNGRAVRLAIGYRYPTDEAPYEVAIAAFTGKRSEPCGVYAYRQH